MNPQAYKIAAVAVAIATTSIAKADIVLNFTGGALFGADTSTPLADGRLIYAVASTNGIFSGPTIGSFTSGNEILLGSWAADSNVGAPGAFDKSITGISLTGGLVADLKIAIYWFETINLGGLTPSGGEKYGFYTASNWLVPADGANVTLSLETQAIGGSVSDTLALANLTVAGSAIPEPSTAAAFGGLAILGFAAARRQRRSA